MKFIRTYKILLIVFILTLITVGNAIACYKPQPTVEPSIEPSIEPTVEVSLIPSVEPTIEVSPTATPEATVAPQDESKGGSGVSDGRSDGLSSCPDCTKAPVIPAGPPAAGRAI